MVRDPSIVSPSLAGVLIDLDESRRYFERSPSSWRGIHNLGISLVMAGYHSEAKTHFIRAAACGYEDSIRSLRIMHIQRQA